VSLLVRPTLLPFLHATERKKSEDSERVREWEREKKLGELEGGRKEGEVDEAVCLGI